MVEIKTRIGLERWLKKRPREDAVVIAARAALRVAPMLVTALDEDAEAHRATIILPSLRALATVWVSAVGPDQGAMVRKAAKRSASDTAVAAAAVSGIGFDFDLAAKAIRALAFASETVVSEVFATSCASAGVIAAGAAYTDAHIAHYANVARATAANGAWKAMSIDATALDEGESPASVATLLLWPEMAFDWAEERWPKLKDQLLRADEGWEVWTNWYDDRLRGHPFNKALEEARVLIPDEIWKQGPKVVNAEIARLIEEHGSPKHQTIELEAGTYILSGGDIEGTINRNLPAERATPIHFEFRDGALHRAPPEPPHPPDDRRAAAKRAWQALRQMLDDFFSSGGGSQNPRLKTVLNRCGNAMGAGFDALDTILLGVHSARLQGFADRADEVLMPEDAAELVALNAQFGLFLAQFPEWADYASGISDGFGTPQDEQQAVADVTAALDQIEQEAPGLIAPDAQEGIAALVEAATPDPTPDNPEPVALPVERRSLLRAARSALRALTRQALADVQVGVSKGIQKSTETTVVAAIAGVTGYLSALAFGLPGEFGWLAAIASYLTRMLGPSSAGQPSKNVDIEDDDDLTDA